MRKRLFSLRTQTVVSLLLFSLSLLGGFVYVINTEGKQLVSQESRRIILNSGNAKVAEFRSTLKTMATVTASISDAVESLPQNESLISSIVPEIINQEGNKLIAGGGFWAEPQYLNPRRSNQSFFWARDVDGFLERITEYDQSGYRQEPWYAVGEFLGQGKCFWSESYIDPFSKEPMVTCTVAARQKIIKDEYPKAYPGSNFIGVSTLDLSLLSLQDLADQWQQEIGGYIFLVDRNNTFITYPKKEFKRLNKSDRYITATELARVYPGFKSIAKKLNELNQKIADDASESALYNNQIIDSLTSRTGSKNKSKAESIMTVLVDPIAKAKSESLSSYNLISEFELKNDWLLKEDSTAYVFHIPETYWKLVIVIPESISLRVADNISKFILLRSLVVLVVLSGLFYVIAQYALVRPITRLKKASSRLENTANPPTEYELKTLLPVDRWDEIGGLARSFESMSKEIKHLFKQLAHQNEILKIAKDNYQSIFDNATEGIFQYKIQGNKKTFIRANKAMSDICGFDSPKNLIESIKDIDEELYASSEEREKHNQVLFSKEIIEFWEAQMTKPNGDLIWVEESVRLVNTPDKVYYEGMSQDITIRKNKELEVQRQLRELKVEIDQQKRKEEVAMITKSEIFKEFEQDDTTEADSFWE